MWAAQFIKGALKLPPACSWQNAQALHQFAGPEMSRWPNPRAFANLSFQEKKRRALAASGQLNGPQGPEAGLQQQTTVQNAPTIQPSETRASSLQVCLQVEKGWV